MADSNWQAKTDRWRHSESDWHSEAQEDSYHQGWEDSYHQGWEEKTPWEARSAEKPSAAHGPEPGPSGQWQKAPYWVAARGSASSLPPPEAASGQQTPAKAEAGKPAQPTKTAREWEEIAPIARDWWREQNRLAERYRCKRLNEDQRVCEVWYTLTTEQVAYIVGGGDLLKGCPERDRDGKSQTAAKFMSRVSQYKEQFPDEPQINKGKQKGKRKSDWENSWKAKMMRTEVGQKIEKGLAAKGKLKGKGGKKGKGKDDSGGKGKYGPPGTGKRPPASAFVGRETA